MRGIGKSPPKYRKHRASGQAVVTLNGVDHYLGPHGTKASKLEYDRLISEWLAAGRQSLQENDGITVVELIAAFLRWGKKHYRKHGVDTGTLYNHRVAFRPLKQFYGRKPVNEFGPKKLKALQKVMVDSGLSRRTINDRCASIKLLFKWGVAEQLVEPAVHQALAAVRGLQKGRTEARESTPVKPVDDAVVDATLAKLGAVVADMVRLQRLTGMRPAEVCIMRPVDIDTSGDVWLYRPESHKTEHHGLGRVVAIGPQGQDVLRPYLLREKSAYCFAPVESEKKRRRELHDRRVIPLHQGNIPGSNRKRKPARTAGTRYTPDSYRRAIQRAADTAKVQRWHPNQLRHSAATRIRATFGLEAAQVTLGHTRADITQVYAERDLTKAIEVAKRIG